MSDFIASHRALQSSLSATLAVLDAHAAAAGDALDLNVEGLRAETPFAAIDRAIDKEVVSTQSAREPSHKQCERDGRQMMSAWSASSLVCCCLFDVGFFLF